MTPFTTSKGEFIAVPVPISGWAPGNYMNTCVTCKNIFKNADKRAHQCIECAVEECKFNDVLPEGNFEIIGLSYDILKDEELASKVCECGLLTLEYHEFQSICERHNITGNNLIIKKK